MNIKSSPRPWGNWIMLDEGQGYWVKKITVDPDKRLSLQWHERRTERWTIVNGHGLIQVGEQEWEVTNGDIIAIPKLTKHRIANVDYYNDLVLIEVALGDPQEDDIVRLEDDWNRV